MNRANPIGRRAFLGGATAAAVASTFPTVSAQSDPDFEAWFGNVDNYDGVVDRTGESSVGITVGAPGNGGAFAYGPAAVRIDPGTTVTWTWTGEGGSHDVAAADGSFGSDMLGEEGATFAHSFDAEGVRYYACTPHESMGMKGAVVVGDVAVGPPETAAIDVDYGGWFDGVDDFEGTVDATGQEAVRVAVGTDGEGQAPAFDPPAVHVDPGTTVTWEWVGDDGEYDVVAADGRYASDVASASGTTFALTFDGDGLSKYYCNGHPEKMRGAVVVGAGPTTETAFTPLAVGATGGFLLAFLYGVYHHFAETLETEELPADDRPAEAPPKGA